MEERTRKRVVILGGGFAGVYTARALEQALSRRDDFAITLINRENHFVFQPLLAEVVSGSSGLLDVASPLRRLLPRTDVYVRDIEAIDLRQRTITTSPGFRPHASVLPFDYLVLALGSVTDFRGLRGLPEHALPFKTLGDALHLRNHVIHALEEAAIETDPQLRRQLLTFVVAGGGFSGVHVVAVLNDFVRGVTRHYRHIDPAELRVLLLHAGARILPEVTEKLARFAHQTLHQRGVEIRLGHRLAAASGEAAILTSGEAIPTRTLVATAPSSPHPLLQGLPLAKGKDSRLLVNPFLEVEGAPHVWALGDCALVPLPGGGVCPPTAQHAVRQARTAAHNIVAAIRGGVRQGFAFKGLGKLCALGHHAAVAEILGLNLSGYPAWWLWRTMYLLKLPGWGRRLKVASSWVLNLLLPPELVQVQLNRSVGITQAHFEPGEAVVHQGDLGDRLYIILSGQAEVVHEAGGHHIRFAQLGPGEYFGEMALLNQATRSATVRCLAPTDVLSLPQREFRTLTAHVPELRQKCETLMVQRQQATERILAHTLARPGEPAEQEAAVRLPAAWRVDGGERGQAAGVKSDRTLIERRIVCERVLNVVARNLGKVDQQTSAQQEDRMPTEQSLTSDIGHIAPVDYEWGAIKWLCNAERMPDCQQSFGYAYVLPGKINPEHQHTTCQEIIYMLAGECDVYMHGTWLHLQPGQSVLIPQGVKHLLKNNGWEPAIYVASFSASFRGTVFTEAPTPAQPADRVYY